MEEKILEDIPPEKYFWTINGTVIKNLTELKTAIEQMDDSTFSHHVNSEKNDFSNWVMYVIKDKELAKDISKVKSKGDMIKLLRKKEKGAGKKKEKTETIGTKRIEANVVKREEKGDEAIIPLGKIEEILAREKEIEKREEKIREIEEKIERRLEEIKNQRNTKFFSKEFIQGIITGLLLAVLAILIYIKFFQV